MTQHVNADVDQGQFRQPRGRVYFIKRGTYDGDWWHLDPDNEDAELLLVESGRLPETYDPSEVKDLFLQFREIPSTESGANAFASRYGLLTSGETLVGPVPENTARGRAERLSLWMSELAQLQSACDLHEAIARGDADDLEAYLSPDVVLEHKELLERAGVPYDWSTEVVDGAINRLEYETAQALSAHCQPRLRLVRASRESNDRPLVTGSIGTGPDSLIGALWLQAADAFCSGREFAKCMSCQRPFTARPRGSKTKRFCSGPCRVRAHRLAATA